MISLRRLFDDCNARFWCGRLPRYRVRRRHISSGGLCDARRRTIWIRSSISAEQKLRQVLLHEMCHIRALGHGKRWQREMLRLAAAGETWAKEEADAYASAYPDPSKYIKVTRRAIRLFIEDWIHSASDAQSIPWAKAKPMIAHAHSLTSRELDERYPGMREVWRRCQRQARREEAQQK